jgi:serine/threonine protein phosphatase PrpC
MEKVGSGHDQTQDAWSYSMDTMVLADGVGGWVSRGIDPALWSHVMVWEVSSAFQKMRDPLLAVRTGLARCRLAGSCTLACLALQKDGRVIAYNIGDSAWLHVRDGRILSKSNRTLREGSKTPRQLGRNLDGNLHGSDIPEDGTIDELEVESGDLLVLTSDGVLSLIDAATLADTLDIDEEPAIGLETLEALLTPLIHSSPHDDLTVLSGRVI